MQHPDAADHVADAGDIKAMPLLALLKLAKKMGVDAEALAEATEQEEYARFRYSEDYPAFTGRIEFDYVVEVFGKRVTRKAKADYTYTPEWRYWDLQKNAEHEGWAGSSIEIRFLTVPEEDNEAAEAEWVKADLLAIDAVWNHVEDAIEEQCRAEDAERRRAAARRAGAPARGTLPKH